MTISNVVWGSSAQWGVSAGGFWSDLPVGAPGTLTLTTSTNNHGGLVFDANTFQPLSYATVGGQSRILDGPVVCRARLRFYVSRTGAHPLPLVIEVGVVPGAQPADFSSSALPWQRNEQSLGTFDLGAVPLVPTTLQVTLELNSLLVRALATSRAAWNGRTAFSLRLLDEPSAGNAVILSNSLTEPVELLTDQEQAFTGLCGYGRAHGRVRAVRDSRFGIPILSDRLVRDGDNPSLWVRSSDYDPDDPSDEFKPDPREGAVDDQIPSP